MKLFLATIGVLIFGTKMCFCQRFLNLDFESANVKGYAVGSSSVPTASALPGWTASYSQPGLGTANTSQIWYDTISLGGAMIVVNDTNASSRMAPIKGYYSVLLVGGSYQTSASISQTGLIPNGTTTLLVSSSGLLAGQFMVSVGGQSINMTPLQSFANYSIYVGDIASFAGQTAQLSFTALPPATGFYENNIVLDNIQFSNSPVPEPGSLALLVAGGLLGAWRWKRA